MTPLVEQGMVSDVEKRGTSIGNPRLPLKARQSKAENELVSDPQSATRNPQSAVSLLTGGGDKPYALGMAAALTAAGISVDFIGSDDLEVPELTNNPQVNFLNLRGDQRPEKNDIAKVFRVL